MIAFKRGLRVGVLTLWGAMGLLSAGVAVAASNRQPPSAQGEQAGTLAEYQKALEANPRSSLVNYRIAELKFSQRQWQASANAYRDALKGDGDPGWVKVWSYLQLGKIFDATGQRERAVLQYQLAVQTNDNTRGAVDEAKELLQKPY